MEVGLAVETAASLTSCGFDSRTVGTIIYVKIIVLSLCFLVVFSKACLCSLLIWLFLLDISEIAYLDSIILKKIKVNFYDA